MNHLRRLIPFLVSIMLLGLILYVSEFAEVWDQFTTFSVEIILFIFVLLLINLFIVSFRLWRVLSRFGNHVQLSTAFKASISGYLGGLFIWSLLGQTLGRQTILYRVGIGSSIVAMITACERILLVFISLSLAVLGAVYLIDNRVIVDLFSGLPIIEIVIVIILAKCLYFFHGRTSFENSMIELFELRKVVSFIAEIGGITLGAQFFMLAAFSTAIWMINPDIPIIEIFSAAAVISFFSSLPISVNGWGVRETASVFVLQYFNIPTEQALAISILIGLCSSAVILVAASYVFKRKQKAVNNSKTSINMENHLKEMEKPAIWLLAIAVAGLVLFQIHIQVPQMDALININLADPFALFAFTIMIQELVQRKTLPQWRFPRFNQVLIIMSVMLFFGFINALPGIGVTSWALGSRLLGWVVILGYLSVGYLITSHLGQQGVRRFTENILLIAMVIILMQVLIRIFDYYGFNIGTNITPRFEGYAANRNAFAFQLLICMSFAIAYLGWYHRKVLAVDTMHVLNQRQILLMAIIFTGLLLTGSIAGIGTGLIILVACWITGQVDKKILMKSCLLGLIFYLGIIYLPPLFKGVNIFSETGGTMLRIESFTQSRVLSNTEPRVLSNTERWETITHGLQMWLENPFLGAGLGAFIESSKDWANEPIVIHSTPVWILAEFGLLGALVYGGIFLGILSFVWNWKSDNPSRRLLFLILAIFAIFSIVHEIFYQRIFWLALGLVMAKPMSVFDNLTNMKYINANNATNKL